MVESYVNVLYAIFYMVISSLLIHMVIFYFISLYTQLGSELILFNNLIQISWAHCI